MLISRSWMTFFRRKFRFVVVAALICIVVWKTSQGSTAASRTTGEAQSALKCPASPLANDTLVILRTGATEVVEKLPVHLETTLRCVPHYTIFSDFEEELHDQQIHDVFDEISQNLKDSVPDFALYHQLKTKGREGLIKGSHDGSGASGSLDNPAWRLDKFKFMPMVDKAFRQKPDAKWFVFMELDTYYMWNNLLDYLSNFDSNKPYYIGKQMFIGDVLFAHGGSGFVLSAAAMRRVTEHWRARIPEYDKYTIESWAGDMVLGKVLKDAGIPLLWAFPHFQGDPVTTLDHNITKADRQPWCYPTITYHHMGVDEVRSFWEFEHASQQASSTTKPLRHSDVFKKYILSSLWTAQKPDWDNYSVEPGFTTSSLNNNPHAHTSFGACRDACKTTEKCLQFSFSRSTCLLSSTIRLGRKSSKQCLEYSPAASKCEKFNDSPFGAHSGEEEVVTSGWMIERLGSYMAEMDAMCDESMDWFT